MWILNQWYGWIEVVGVISSRVYEYQTTNLLTGQSTRKFIEMIPNKSAAWSQLSL